MQIFFLWITLFYSVMKQLVLTLLALVGFLAFGSGTADAQGCTLDISSKYVMKLTCTSLDHTEFDMNTSALPFKSEAAVRDFCPMANSNYLTFSPIEGTKNVHVVLLQNSTPGRSWTVADWNLFFERNAIRLQRAMENTNR
jgi:hypothetical protein